MYNENIYFWLDLYLIIEKYFWVLRVRFYFIRPKRMPENRGSLDLPTSASFRSSVGTHASYCTPLRAAGQLLAAARAVARQRAHGWQPWAEIQESRHMAGSHVWATRNLLYTHTQNPGTCIRGTPAPGLGACCNPGARYPYTPSGGSPRPRVQLWWPK
jgi:hypothetical protein